MANISKPTTLNTIWASTGTKVDPGITKTNIGWVVQLPPYEYQNWAMNRQDTAIAHFNQHGVPEWDVVTEYQGNLSYSQGSNGFIYKCIQTHTGLDPTNTNNNLYWKLAFEEYGSVQIVQSALNAHLANYATLSGISNIVLARANLSVYSKAEGDTRYAFKGGDNATPFLVGTASNAQHAVPLSQINSLLVPATESVFGTTRYATVSETETGTIDNKAITPLKGATIYLKKSGNLAGLADTAVARTNLGLGTAATQGSGSFLQTANNLSDVPDKIVARSNLGLTSMAVADPNGFMYRNNNLNDVLDKQAARNNLQLGAHVTFDPNVFLYKNENLAGLTSPAAARTNLGLQDSVLYPSNTWLIKSLNLGDLTNIQAARNNLQLGNLATKSAFGVPGDLQFQHGGDTAAGGWAYLGSNLTMQWGIGPLLRFDQSYIQGLHIPGFIMNVNIQAYGTWQNDQGPSFLVDSLTSSSFRVSENGSQNGRQYMWQALVYV